MVMPSEIARVNLIWTPQAAWSGESAVCGFWVQHQHFTGNDWDWDRDLQELADNVRDKLVELWGTVAGQFGTGFKISEVRAAQIGTDGHEINAKTSAVTGTALAGSASAILPPEVALCLSFYGFVPGTFTSHPGQKRGRMYLPYIAQSMPDGQGKVSLVQAKVDAWGAIFNDIQGMHGGHPVPPGNSSDFWKLVTVSKVAGTATQVEAITIDDHFDSQRRRQHQSPSTKYQHTIDH
jgi:hypothetical protein